MGFPSDATSIAGDALELIWLRQAHVGRRQPMNSRLERRAIEAVAIFIVISAVAGGIGLIGHPR